MASSRTDAGFTLAELSIVLVILGLLVGGILAGENLIFAATMRKVGTDYTTYETAINAFREKYDCLPGDCPHMTRFMTGGCSWPATGNMTCNGDGNGIVWPYETHYVCQHLSYGGMVSAACFGGLAMDSGNPQGVQGGQNALPTSLNKNNMLWFSYADTTGWPPFSAYILPGNYFSIYTNSGAGNYYPGSIVSNADMWVDEARIVDTKIDDGRPFSGRMRQFDFHCGDPVTNTYNPLTFGAHERFCHSFYKYN